MNEGVMRLAACTYVTYSLQMRRGGDSGASYFSVGFELKILQFGNQAIDPVSYQTRGFQNMINTNVISYSVITLKVTKIIEAKIILKIV